MQDFSDKLNDDEQGGPAREIGSDSSLIRWATTEVESLGLSVTNNRVQENSDMMWQEWLQESSSRSNEDQAAVRSVQVGPLRVDQDLGFGVAKPFRDRGDFYWRPWMK